jgi:hypothetical protein
MEFRLPVMRLWARLTALLMALLIAPSSVLAAMPVAWCVGADGHRAIEFSLSSTGKHHHADHLTLAGESVAPSGVEQADRADGECQHWQLVDASKASEKRSVEGVIPLHLRLVVSLPALSLLEALEARRPWLDVSSATRRPPDPQRLELRSIILLI